MKRRVSQVGYGLLRVLAGGKQQGSVKLTDAGRLRGPALGAKSHARAGAIEELDDQSERA
jgi:hypothetical protein